MSLASLYTANKTAVSFELFPPKTERGERALFRHVTQLMTLQPDYVTCTYGAGGSTRDKTLALITKIKEGFRSPVASHLTCVQSSLDQLREYLDATRDGGIDYIVALRGDPPIGEDAFRPPPNGLRFANELVTLIRSEYPSFGIAVAGYPETHREAVSAEADLDNLKRKVDAGAEIVITQLFYDNNDFFRFRARAERAGIRVPLVPGILPVTRLDQVQRISALCGARLPEPFVARLTAAEDMRGQFEVGVDYAVHQVAELIREGVAGLHFFVLNRSEATTAILRAVRPSCEADS